MDMDQNKIIILALVIVIAILAVGLFSMVHNAKQDTIIIIDGNSTIHQGDTIDIVLKDSNNTPISNKILNVTVGRNNESNNYLINTNDQGIAKLKINESEGNYTINCTFSAMINIMPIHPLKKYQLKFFRRFVYQHLQIPQVQQLTVSRNTDQTVMLINGMNQKKAVAIGLIYMTSQ